MILEVLKSNLKRMNHDNFKNILQILRKDDQFEALKININKN
jgi:hypothetical protein